MVSEMGSPSHEGFVEDTATLNKNVSNDFAENNAVLNKVSPKIPNQVNVGSLNYDNEEVGLIEVPIAMTDCLPCGNNSGRRWRRRARMFSNSIAHEQCHADYFCKRPLCDDQNVICDREC